MHRAACDLQAGDYDARNNCPVAQCFSGEDDLQAMMESAGWALSFGRFSETALARGWRAWSQVRTAEAAW